MIGVMCKTNLKGSSSDYASDDILRASLHALIEQAITLSFAQRGKDAGMREVLNNLMGMVQTRKEEGMDTSVLQRLCDSLYPYGNPNGKFFKYFNGKNNIDLYKDYVILELEELKNKGDLFYTVIIGLLQMIATEYFYDRKREKIFVVDEAWAIMDEPLIVSFLEDLSRRIRKYNGANITITQSITDFYKNPQTLALFQNANWKVFLQQTGDSIDMASKDGKISLSNFEVDLMKSIRSKPPLFSEIYIKDEHDRLIGRVKTDPFSHWVFTNHPKDMKQLNGYKEKYQLTSLEAITFMAFLWEYGESAEAILERVKVALKNASIF